MDRNRLLPSKIPAIIAVGALTQQLLAGVIAFRRPYANLYPLDSGCVRMNHGMLFRNERALPIEDPRSEVGLRQSVMGRLLGYGMLTFAPAGLDRRDMVWRGFRGPRFWKKATEALIRHG